MIVQVAFTSFFIVFLLLERFVHAVATLIARLVWGTHKCGSTQVKGYASMQMIGSGFSYFTAIASAVTNVIATMLTGVASYLIWAMALCCIFACMYIVQIYYPQIMINFTNYWSNNIGPVLHTFLVIPAKLLNIIFWSVVPFYNGLVWFFTQIIYNGFINIGLKDLDIIRSIGVAIASMFKNMTLELHRYILTFAVVCPQPVSNTCFDTGQRTFDFITPMADARAIAIGTANIGRSMCQNLQGPLDIILYPFIDINYAKGLHNILNAVLFTLIQVPSITLQRCAAFQSTNSIMCLPDFEPSFNMLTAGCRNLGQMLDNWLDIFTIIAQTELGLDPDTECEQIAATLSPANYSKELFGDSDVSIVGLTDGLYAVTDGKHIQYFNHYDGVHSITVPNAWPFQVDVKLGIAAVTYFKDAAERDSAGNPTTTMLGCTCTDDNGAPPMKIKCALALKEASVYGESISIDSDLTFNVEFQQRSTANYMTCKSSQINIQSVRWPATRFTKPNTQETTLENTCYSKGTCGTVDATIWVAPLCSSSASTFQQVCAPDFLYASCYPYCMAARRSGSAADGLVLYDASDWKNRVHMTDRDCGVKLHLTNPVAAVSSGTSSYSVEGEKQTGVRRTVTTVTSNDILSGAVTTINWDPNVGCVDSTNARSMVGLDVMPGYSSDSANKGMYRSILMPGQPFSFAGDVTLTSIKDGAGNYFVAVDRLYGNEVNEFTMVNVQKQFPANPPADTVQILGNDQGPFNKLPIPYTFSDMAGIQHPSVSSQSAVYMAVNPSLGMFKAFAKWCSSKGAAGMTQLVALSSYAPIRVWKIEPFTYCPNGNDGRPDCGPGHVGFVDIPEAFTNMSGSTGWNTFDTRKCTKPFSMQVTHLEYINPENIAVTILRASISDVDLETGKLISTKSSTLSRKIMFISTVTMALSETPWQRDLQISMFAQGTLCPAMRRFPNVGSMFMETACAVINFARPIVGVVVSMPGLVKMWQNQQSCALETHGHSLLKKCGADVFSLDDFFESLNRANAHFWRSFGIIADRIRDMGETRTANVLNGIAYYGDATTSPLTVYRSVIRAVRIPNNQIGTQIMQGVFPMTPNMLAANLAVSANPLRIAQFSYKLITGIITDIIILSMRIDKSNGADVEASRELLALMNNRLSDARDAYYNSITLGILQGCNGLSLMLGYTNPWATLLRKQCESGPVAVQGAYDMAMSLLVDVPFAKCVCVDAASAGSSFQDYAMQNCYYFAPNYLKPMMLGLIQTAMSDPAGIQQACTSMVTYAKSRLSSSMQPWFSVQLQAAESIASSLDYFLRFTDSAAGRCNDVAENPYASVMIPEPVDYFNACGATSMCKAKCYADFTSFDAELARVSSFSTAQTTSIESKLESRFFVNMNEDSFTPMAIVSMVELIDCSSVCGGSVYDSDGNYKSDGNVDTCIAVAGIDTNTTIVVKKYCIPKAVSQSVRLAPWETWYVWYSEEWTDTAQDIKFAETLNGDTLIVRRDNRGRSTDTGPNEQFISVHPRSVQKDPALYSLVYGRKSDRISRLTLIKATENEINGVPKHTSTILIGDMHILPSGISHRVPWVLVSFVTKTPGDATVSHKLDVCISLDLSYFIQSKGNLAYPAYACDLNSFFDVKQMNSYTPVIFSMEQNSNKVDILMVPNKKGSNICIYRWSLQGENQLGSMHQVCFNTPASFTSNSLISTVSSWVDFSRTMLQGTASSTPLGRQGQTLLSQQGIAVNVQKTLAQNTLITIEKVIANSALTKDSSRNSILIFSSNDPSANAHWLTQLRIILTWPEQGAAIDAQGDTASYELRSSHVVTSKITVIHSCNRYSCLGCTTTRLQMLCYAAQSCAISKCIGTVVHQNRPLCNLGLSLQSNVEQTLTSTMGAWMIFTESYSTILDLSLDQTKRSGVSIEWVDDAFFGFVCTAKDSNAQIASIMTSAIGAALVETQSSSWVDPNGNIARVANVQTANANMILKGVNSFMYQMLLFPLYQMIATQKAFMCTANAIFAIISESGFDIILGRKDMQLASDGIAGKCMTTFYESEADNVQQSDAKASLSSGANEMLSRSGPDALEAYSKANSIYTGQSTSSGSTGSAGSTTTTTQSTASSAPSTASSTRQTTSTTTSSRSTADPSTRVITRLINLFATLELRIPMHYIDSFVSYLIGVVSGIQSMAQAADIQNCKVSDYYISNVTRCACNDDPLTIPPQRRTQGFDEKAHWCTGTLKMTDAFGRVKYIYNPLTYEALKNRVGDMDKYLRCISLVNAQTEFKGLNCDRDVKTRVPEIENQGVSAISVLQRCKSNYQQMKWDDGAFLAYDTPTRKARVLTTKTIDMTNIRGSVGECLTSAEASGESNDACMKDYIDSTGSVYWSYERIDPSSAYAADSKNIDACEVFSGPAKHKNAEVALEFKKCASMYEESGCKIPHMIWSAGSVNNVPVANLHSVADTTTSGRSTMAESYFQSAYAQAMQALLPLQNFTDSNLDVALFSAEGDSLHQIFDCIMQGPYSRVDMWSRGSNGELKVPNWARDEGGAGLTRDMDLPCLGSKLKGDTKPPFTCGGDTRRSIIKYFVRDVINKRSSGDGRTASMIENTIRQQVRRLIDTWSNKEKYKCLCADKVTTSLTCCATYASNEETFVDGRSTCTIGVLNASSGKLTKQCTNNFLPPALNTPFDEINGDDIIRSIINEIPAFVKGILSDPTSAAFTSYNTDEEIQSWNWVASGQAHKSKADAMYTTYEPITKYSSDESGYPFRGGKSIWHMCTGLISQVMFTMPMGEVNVDKDTNSDEGWMWTAASVISLRAKGLEFDYTLSPTFDGAESANGLTMLERYVSKVLEGALSDSPMFWYYAMRHVPSDSLICARDLVANPQAGSTRRPAGSKLKFTNAGNILGLDTAHASFEMDMYGYDAFPLGAASKTGSCFCGWDAQASGGKIWCKIPNLICQAMNYSVNVRSDCLYELGSKNGIDATKLASSMWGSPMQGRSGSQASEWVCPEIDASDAWGVVSGLRADAWITETASTLQDDIADVVFSGRSGMRLGNMDTIKDRARKDGVWPNQRVHKLQSDQTNYDNIAVKRCASSIMQTFDAQDLSKHLVDDLFPVAQAVRESAPLSVCLRFAIEYARLRVATMIIKSVIEGRKKDSAKDKETLRSLQNNVRTWRKRCEAQLQMVGACRGNGIFEIIPSIQDATIANSCPFTITDSYQLSNNYYITPGCIVYIKQSANTQGFTGAFFDPCRMQTKPCTNPVTKQSFSIGEILSNSAQTKIAFDVRGVGSKDVLGKWPISFSSYAGEESNIRLNVVARSLEEWKNGDASEEAFNNGVGSVPWRLQPDFLAKVFETGGTQARGSVGNTGAGKNWGTAEGFAGADQSAELCDGIADWWPEDWTKPVGYHVTVPCNKDQAGYRTFDSAFAMDRGDGSYNVVMMKYMHNALRDPETFHSRFGTAGLCRKGTYGMPQFVTNTMRVCTKDSVNVSYDATVPVKPRYTNADNVPAFSQQEYCSDDPFQIPWSIDSRSVAHPSMLSIGNAPMYRGEMWNAQGVYPTTERMKEVQNTHPGTTDHSWGQSCTDGQLLYCDESKPCIPTSAGVQLECKRNTCVLKMSQNPSCYSHADCISSGKLCSGDGLCVDPIWQVENDLGDDSTEAGTGDIEFSLYGKDCKSNNQDAFPVEMYDMYGASAWQNVPDILKMYGMCSYRNWFEYLEFFDSTNATAPGNQNALCSPSDATAGTCVPDSINAESGTWMDTNLDRSQRGLPTLWSTRKFRVMSHACDRDYERVEGMRGCAPIVLNDNSAMGMMHMRYRTQKFSLDHAPRTNITQTFNRAKYFMGSAGGHAYKQILKNSPSSPWSTYRKYGFLSMPTMASSGKVFTRCSDESQCRSDPFTYNGIPLSGRREAFNGSALIKYTNDFFDMCGQFGIRVPEAKCTGIATGQACCMIDSSVIPLYEMACTAPSSKYMADIDKACNRGGAPNTIPILSASSVSTACNNIPQFYTTSLTDRVVREASLASVRDAINSLTDEFIPDTPIVNSMHYMQVMDCSQHIYWAMQNATACQMDPSTDNKTPLKQGPFCTSYHVNEKNRLGIYYMLKYTMLEVPYSWWHKCMLLQSRTFASALPTASSYSITCPEWRTNNIKMEDMLSARTQYVKDAWSTLKKIEGGLTNNMLNPVMQSFKDGLLTLIRTYISGATSQAGFNNANSATTVAASGSLTTTNEMDTASRATAIAEKVSARQGTDKDFTLTCYDRTKLLSIDKWNEIKNPPDNKKGVDCVMEILKWVIQDRAAPDVFFQSNTFISQGSYGVPARCYAYDDSTIIPDTNIKPPYEYIMDELLGENPKTLDNIPAFNDITPNDFFRDANNDEEKGLLIAEYIPSALQDIPVELPGYNEISSIMTDDPTYMARSADSFPCVKIEDIKDKLKCQAEAKIPERKLTAEDCNKAAKIALDRLNVLETYVQASNFWKLDGDPYPASPKTCFQNCKQGHFESHTYRNKGLLPFTSSMMNAQIQMELTTCLNMARTSGEYCYDSNYDENTAPSYYKYDPNDDIVTVSKDANPMTGGFSINFQSGCWDKIMDTVRDVHHEEDWLGKYSWKQFKLFDEYMEPLISPVQNGVYTQFTSTTGSRAVDAILKRLIGIIESITGSYYVEFDAKLGQYKTTTGEPLIFGSSSAPSTSKAYKTCGKYYNMIAPNYRVLSFMTSEEENILYKAIVGDLFKFSIPCTKKPVEYCLPPTNKITASNIHKDASRPEFNGCFKMAVIAGKFNCTFKYAEGLKLDTIEAAKYTKTPLTTATSKTPLRWRSSSSSIVDPSAKDSGTSNYARVVNTIFTRMISAFMSAEAVPLTTAFARPQSIDFFEHSRANWPAAHEYFSFNIQNKLNTEATILTQGQDCLSSPTISYGTCSDKFLMQYDKASANFNTFIQKKGPIIIPSGYVLVWPGLSATQHMQSIIPAWALSNRNQRAKFAQWIMNRNVQCPLGEEKNSICTTDPDTGLKVAVNPWIGGDFNPWERCDTRTVGRVQNAQQSSESIFLSCHPEVCTKGLDSPYYTNQPNANCITNNNMEVQTRKFSDSNYEYPTNICSRKPDLGGSEEGVEDPLGCKWAQGMLLKNMQGNSVTSLYEEHPINYRDAVIAVEGKGLFVKGGNPIYYTMKGSQDEVERNIHSIIKQNAEDLGGHHIVLKMTVDPITGVRFMHVDRTPLAASTVLTRSSASVAQPVAMIYDASKKSSTTHGTSGWLENLQPIMEYEQQMVDPLYPTSDSAREGTKWLCPLRRMAFWTSLVDDFNPLVPSPTRSARLFGNRDTVDMTYGTRSHPTQLFASINSLANVMTSNGFCFCTTAAECQVPHTSVAFKQCTLQEIIKSLYDQTFRQAVLINQADASICTQQLDWPFEGGTMRDGTINPGRNPVAQKCNVIDRLPPFQYRYSPSGKMYKPPDEKTTLDKGGACHMGPAPSYAPLKDAQVDTLVCRTIDTNFTHVLTRCDRVGAQPIDIALPKQRSRAPPWMIENMKKVRQSCSTCSGPPQWRVEKTNNNMPASPEVSQPRSTHTLINL